MLAGCFLGALGGASSWIWAEFDPPALRSAEQSYRRNDFEASLRMALAHLRWHPFSGQAAELAALSLSRLDRPVEAEAYYRRAGALDRQKRHVRAMGWVVGDYREEAIRAYREALDRDPDDLLAMRRLAAVYVSQARWWDAEVVAGRMTRHPHGLVAGRTLEGLAHLRQGNYEQSVAAFEAVLAIDPTLKQMPLRPPGMFWSNLAEALLKVGRAADVRRYLGRAMAEEEDPVLAGMMARACQQEGDLDEAERWFRVVAQRGPDLPGPWLELGRMALLRDRPAESIELLRRAAALRPKSADVLYSMSQALRRLGRLEEADRFLALSRELRKPAAAPSTVAGPHPMPES